MIAGHRPAVGSASASGGRQDGVEGGEQGSRFGEQPPRGVGPRDDRRRPEIDVAFRSQGRQQAGAQELGPPVVFEFERHHPRPDETVGRSPGFGADAEEQEFEGRQRSGGDRRLDTRHIGLDQRPAAPIERGEIGFGPAVETEGAHQPVARQGRRSQDLGEPSLAEAAVELHLPQPVLAVDEAETEIGVPLVGGADGGDAEGVA